MNIRPPQYAGSSYPDSASACRAMMDHALQSIETQNVQTQNAEQAQHGTLIGALIPHIDFRVNIECYAAAYSVLQAVPKPDVVLILATSHYGWQDVIIPTYQHFETPLGVAQTDTAFLDMLYQQMPTLTHDDSAHAPEHSIEFEVLWLQHIWGENVPIIPLLITGAHYNEHILPTRAGRMNTCVEVLRDVLNEYQKAGKNIFVIVSGDLSHVGKRFGDRYTARAMALSVTRYEQALIDTLAECSNTAYFRALMSNDDAYRICGAMPTMTMLSLFAPQQSRFLYHSTWYDDANDTSVGFASMLFYAP